MTTAENPTALRFQAQLQEQHQEGGEVAAPAATPAPAPKTPSNAAVAPQERLSEDEQIISDLRSEWAAKEMAPRDDDEVAEDAPEPEEKPAKAPKAKAPKGKDAKPAAKGDDEKGSAAPKYESVDAALAAFTKALESGDPEAIAKAVGKPKGFMDVSEQKWAAFREQKQAVREREKTVQQREHQFSQNLAEARKELGPIVNAKKAYNDGDVSKFVELVNELIKESGDTYDEAQRKVIKGHIAVDPATKKLRDELKQLRDERAADKAKDAEEKAKGTQAQQYAAAVEGVRAELAAHAVAKVKGFERMVLDKVRESWDGADYTKSFEEAADEIVEDRRAEAEALGYQRPAPAAAPVPRARPGAQVPPRAHAADARRPDGEDWEQRDLSDEEIIASIKRDVRTGRIKVT